LDCVRTRPLGLMLVVLVLTLLLVLLAAAATALASASAGSRVVATVRALRYRATANARRVNA